MTMITLTKKIEQVLTVPLTPDQAALLFELVSAGFDWRSLKEEDRLFMEELAFNLERAREDAFIEITRITKGFPFKVIQ